MVRKYVNSHTYKNEFTLTISNISESHFGVDVHISLSKAYASELWESRI